MKGGIIIYFAIVSIVSSRVCHGKELNLTESCSGLQSPSCVLFDISTSFGNPFIIANSTNFELNELIIRNVVLLRFPREIFEYAPNLHTFMMYNCGLNRIRSYDFEQSSNLSRLILQRNRLSEIGEKVFIAVRSLRELRLGQNHIHMVHQSAFEGLEQLVQLDLQQNAIYQLAQNLFSPLANLEYLDLSGNEITKIDSSTFAGNPKLTTLLLNNNKFIVFEPNSLDVLPHLHLLDVSNCFLEELNAQSIDTLYAQNSSLKRCSIRGSVIKLHASNNELTELKIADRASVRELVLHGNLFDSFNDFVDLVNLQHLDLSKNHISTFANSRSSILLSFPNLNYLNLAFNKMKNLTVENFLLLPKLTHLDLAFNHLNGLDAGIFESLTKLEKLFIDGNGLHNFDYRKFLDTHAALKEVGLSANSWSPRQIQEMIRFLDQRSIQLSHHYPANLNEMYSTASSPVRQHFKSPEVTTSPVHLEHSEVTECSSSTPSGKDTVAVLTLVLVFIILVMQIFRIFRERNCCSLIWRRKTSRLGQQFRTEPLDESVSEV